MTAGLPTREFVQLAPPEGGSLAVRREARRRQRRRAVVTSGGAAVVVISSVLLLQGGRTAHDSLQVTDNPTTSTSASPQTSSSPAPRSTSSPVPGSGASVAPGAVGSPASQPSATPQTEESAVPAGYRTPDLARAYSDRTTFGAVSFCTGSASGSGQDNLQSTVDWCPKAVVTDTVRGHDLDGQVCRDGSSDARLTFARQQEVELTVRRSDGTVVWRWSAGHADASSPHTLDVAKDHCWDWTAPWTDVDAQGRVLPSGSYELEVTSRADELRTAPVATASFTL